MSKPNLDPRPVRKILPVAKKRAILAELDASGKTVKAFCEEKGIKEANIYAWRKALSEGDGPKKPPEHEIQHHHEVAPGEKHDLASLLDPADARKYTADEVGDLLGAVLAGFAKRMQR